MSILVNFEDTYGIADIVCQHFFNQVLNIGENGITVGTHTYDLNKNYK